MEHIEIDKQEASNTDHSRTSLNKQISVFGDTLQTINDPLNLNSWKWRKKTSHDKEFSPINQYNVLFFTSKLIQGKRSSSSRWWK